MKTPAYLLGTSICFSTLSAHAGVIEVSSGTLDAGIAAYQPIGQSFIAEDAFIDDIAFSFTQTNRLPAGDGVVTMSLYEGTGFTGTLLGSTTMDLSGYSLPNITEDILNFIDFDFSGIELVVGVTYSVAVTTNDASIFISGSGDDVYAGGFTLESAPFADLPSCSPGCDLNFRVTPSAVPVPAAVWLFGSGLLGLVGVARRRSSL